MPTITGETDVSAKTEDGIIAQVPKQTVAIIEKAPSLKPNTTEEEDITTAGQRKINLIWEYTQAIIAGMVVLSNMVVGTYHGVITATGNTRPEYPVILSSSFFLIIGFYFSRTNHAAIGGIGKKPNTEYTGR